MYICPICNEEFYTEEAVSKHLLKCWKHEHPYHKAKAAPQSKNINTREVSNEMLNFFSALQGEKCKK